MKRQPKGAKQRRQAIQVYTYAQAQSVAPYLTSIVRSVREHSLEALTARRRLKQLDRRPGRPNRDALIEAQEIDRQAQRAEDSLRDALAEMQHLDVYPLDPVRGQALVPFVHEEQLAWFVFDLFDPQPLQFWRFQTDPEDTRRPVTPRQHGRAESAKA
jgi:hypothetical protein